MFVGNKLLWDSSSILWNYCRIMTVEPSVDSHPEPRSIHTSPPESTPKAPVVGLYSTWRSAVWRQGATRLMLMDELPASLFTPAFVHTIAFNHYLVNQRTLVFVFLTHVIKDDRRWRSNKESFSWKSTTLNHSAMIIDRCVLNRVIRCRKTYMMAIPTISFHGHK